MALSPITAAVLGWLFRNEAISLQFGLGLAAVIIGLWVAHWQPMKSGAATVKAAPDTIK